MDETLANLIAEAIKIISPAIIASYATYKATKTQYSLRLAEQRENHCFKAKEALLQYYKDQRLKSDEGYKSLSDTLSQILGYMSTDEHNKENTTITSSIFSICNMYTGLAPFDIEATIRDMTSANMTESEEFKKLLNYVMPAKKLKATKDSLILKENVFFLLDLYSFLGRCNQKLLEVQTNKLFSKYAE